MKRGQAPFQLHCFRIICWSHMGYHINLFRTIKIKKCHFIFSSYKILPTTRMFQIKNDSDVSLHIWWWQRPTSSKSWIILPSWIPDTYHHYPWDESFLSHHPIPISSYQHDISVERLNNKLLMHPLTLHLGIMSWTKHDSVTQGAAVA